jgi:mRNA interferase MazF
MGMVKRGDIFLADLEPVRGSEQGGIRPVLIVQNNISNNYSPVVIVVAITSKVSNKEYPTDVFVSKRDSNLNKDSTILLNQIRTLDKNRLKKKISSLPHFLMHRVDLALKISLGLEEVE